MLCSKCTQNVPDHKILWHLRTFHHGEKDLQVSCPSCTSVLNSFESFQKHWYTIHRNETKKRQASCLLDPEKNSDSDLLPPKILKTVSPNATDNSDVSGAISAGVLEERESGGICDVSASKSSEPVLANAEDSDTEIISNISEVIDDSTDTQSEREENFIPVSVIEEKASVPCNVSVNNHAASFILKLKDKCCIPSSSLKEVISATETLIKSSLVEFSSEVNQKLKSDNLSLSKFINVEESINKASNVFENIRTEYQQNKFFVENLKVVQPLRIPLGREFRRVRAKSKGVLKTVSVAEEFMYVPIPDVVRQLINHPDYKNFVENGSMGGTSKFLDSYMQGRKAKSNPVLIQNPDALRFVLYYDDLECCSPLKSRSGKQKLAAFYMYLDNIPHKFRSNLSAIFLVALVNSNFIKEKKYGMDSALEHIVKDLKCFEEGVMIDGIKVNGTLIATIGDNLGEHAVGGFKEGFTAYRCCRFCLATHQECQTLTRENGDVLRTVESHKQQCSEVQTERGKNESCSTEYGINRDSLLNTLRSYHVVGGLPPDLLHDILEGVLPLAIKRLLRYYLYEREGTKIFTLDWLNKTLKDFDYGYAEAADKPSDLKKENITDDSTSLHQSACQLWLLGTVLPLILGPLLSTDDEHYRNFLDCLEICRIIFSTEISPWMVVYLQDLIETYLTDYISLYGCLIPKQHHLTHYPSQILLMGSLVNYMCLRCEAKHKFFKKLVNILGSYKNIPWTLARKHQLSQAAAWSDSLKTPPTTGPNFVKQRIDLTYISLLPLNVDKVIETSWLKYEGVKFVAGQCFLCIGCDDSKPVFVKVWKVLVSPSILFICQKVNTTSYDIHLAAYQIDVSSELCTVQPSSLLLSAVFHAHFVKDNIYIPMKCCAGDAVF